MVSRFSNNEKYVKDLFRSSSPDSLSENESTIGETPSNETSILLNIKKISINKISDFLKAIFKSSETLISYIKNLIENK